MNHWGIPGPGGSLGKCAVCGDSFAAGVIKDLMGLPSGISSFNVGFIDETLYAHDPECVHAVKKAFKSDDPDTVKEALPEGPLKDCLAEAIEKRNEP